MKKEKKVIILALLSIIVLTGCLNKNVKIGSDNTSGSNVFNSHLNSESIENSKPKLISGNEISICRSSDTNVNANSKNNSSISSGIANSSNSWSDNTVYAGIPLDEYLPPNDGIEYDKTPLQLNVPMNIVTRNADKLYDGVKEFRFISSNAPTLLDCTSWEQEDLVKTIAQMGGQVTRSYTFSVNTKQEGTSTSTGKYILGIGNYNEAAFRKMDNLLAMCNKYGVRVIIPFIDPYEYNGGIPAFNEMFNKKTTGDKSLLLNAASFYSDPSIKNEFFQFVKFVLNRKNTITGVYYKNDPTIMAWESGNEMPYYNEAAPFYDPWMKELIQVIKGIDSKHLIMDGSAFGIRSQAESDPDIDIVTLHMYPHTVSKSYAEECKIFKNYFKNKKPVIIGEFGFVETKVVESLYNEAIKNETTGTLLWSLRQHSENGSFIQHRENAQYFAYHWPGFTAGASYDEKGLLRLTYLKAFEIQGKKPKLIQSPNVPKVLTPLKNPQLSIVWRGSTGAYGYDIQRSKLKSGPWETIGVNISDDFFGVSVLFADSAKGLIAGKSYYYRIRAKSVGGFSAWSEPVSAIIKNNT